MVPTTQSADLRAYYSKHTKNGQLDSKLSSSQHGLTKAGDALLREAVFAAADGARKTDPRRAAKYARLMATDRHHDSALCHIATARLTRIATCWLAGTPYVITDTVGTQITPEEGRRIVREHHNVPRQTRINAASTGNPNAERVERTGSRRSRWALQHPGPPPTPQPHHSRLTSLRNYPGFAPARRGMPLRTADSGQAHARTRGQVGRPPPLATPMNGDHDAKCVYAGQVRCRCAVERAPSTLRRQNRSRNAKLDSELRLRRIELPRSPRPADHASSERERLQHRACRNDNNA
jgi:hypothetical protein